MPGSGAISQPGLDPWQKIEGQCVDQESADFRRSLATNGRQRASGEK